MRLFWEIIERVDHQVFRLKDRADVLRKRPALRERVAREVAEVRPPQRVIQLDR